MLRSFFIVLISCKNKTTMGKPLLYRLFKIGKLPKNINRKKLILCDEGIRITARYKDFKSPGKSFKRKTTGMIGSIVVSKKRISAFALSSPILNLELKDERLKQIDFSESSDKILSMQFEASAFSEEASGTITYLFHTPIAKKILDKIN